MLSVILDPLSGPSWWLSLSFLIIIASTASKIFLFLQNLITKSRDIKITNKLYILIPSCIDTKPASDI